MGQVWNTLSSQEGLCVLDLGSTSASNIRLLTEMGSDRAQGYYISRPLPPSQLVKWCNGHRARPELLRAA